MSLNWIRDKLDKNTFCKLDDVRKDASPLNLFSGGWGGVGAEELQMWQIVHCEDWL